MNENLENEIETPILHTPIPVHVAREIATSYRKSMVVILAYDPTSRLTHTTTYGVKAHDKEIAAEVGERCAKLICGDGFESRSYEDYRFIEAGKRAEQIDRLDRTLTACRHALASIVVVRDEIPNEKIQRIIDAADDVLKMSVSPKESNTTSEEAT